MRERWRVAWDRLSRFVSKHQAIFWALHSAWALSWGVVFLVVGGRRPDLLRWGLVSIGVVWATGLVLPALLAGPWIPAARTEVARKAVLWGQKWLLQGLAFFILPIYHRSATYPSRNSAFVAVLVLAALAATVDVVYDEVVARRRWLFGVFLSFVAFACVNLTLPMVFRVGGRITLTASAALATAVFLSFWVRPAPRGTRTRAWAQVVAVGVLFFSLVAFGRAWVPPAPLRLVSARFGTSLAPDGLDVSPALPSLPPAREIRLYAVAAIRAPAGLAEGVRHVWSVNGRTVFESRPIEVTGGRTQGFRSRSFVTLRDLAPGQRVRMEVETASGQLLGRAEIAVR